MTGAATIEAYLHAHIPLSSAMGLRVTHAGADRVTLCAPLAPNLNHEANAFGGSISALAILAGWTYLYARLAGAADPTRIVIQQSEVRYLRPIQDGFCATAAAPSDDEWERFAAALRRRNRARIPIRAAVESRGEHAATFSGLYVALA